jgi:tetratricopeptide (TPR) repeat protein
MPPLLRLSTGRREPVRLVQSPLFRPCSASPGELMWDDDELLKAVRDAEAAEDPEKVDAAREAYLQTNPRGPQAAEVRYRHGLSRLFRHQDSDGAMALFKAASQEKDAAVAPEARVSYALILHAKGKRQQAIFELRKLLPAGAPPSIHTANGLDFLALILRESGAKADEIDKVEDQRIEHLEDLSAASDDPVEKAHWLLRLGSAWADRDRPTAIAHARTRFSEVVKLGPKAGASAVEMARAQLKLLPR